MAVPVILTGGGGNSGNALSLSWNGVYGNHAINDIGLVVVETSGEGTTLPVSAQAGWAHVPGSPFVTAASTAGTKLNVLWKRADTASQAAFNTGDSGDHQVGRLFVIRGCITTGDPWDAVAGGTQTAASTTLNFSSVTTAGTDRLVIHIGSRPDDNSGDTIFGTPVNSNLSNITDVFEIGSTTGNGGGLMVSSGEKASAGATGSSSASSTLNTTFSHVTIAFRADAGGGGGTLESVQAETGSVASDVATATVASTAAVAESATATDTQSVSVSGGTLESTQSESATATDTTNASISTGNAKVETFTEDFSTFDTTTKWSVSNGAESTSAVSNGELVQTIGTTVEYTVASSFGLFDLTGSSIYVKMVQPLQGTLTAEGAQVGFRLVNNAGDEILGFNWNTDTSVGNLAAIAYIGASYNTPGWAAFDATNHKWLRIRENAGTIYFDYAPDSGGAPGTWVNHGTFATANVTNGITALRVQLLAGDYTSPGTITGPAKWDNINTTGAVTYEKTTAETATAADAQSAGYSAAGAQAETATATDSQTRLLAQAGTVAETATATDSQTRLLAQAGTVAETATATDSQTRLLAMARAVAEAASATESTTAAKVGTASQVEAATATDTQNTGNILAATQVENATALDTQRVSPISDVVVLTDNQLVADAKWNDPNVIAEAGGWTMYASCGVGFTGEIRIFRLRSTDRVNWTLSPSTPVLEKGASGAWDDGAVETPSVCWYGGQYHLFYTGYPVGGQSDSKTYKIGHAVSADGISWTKDASYLLAPTDPLNNTPTMDFRQWLCAEPGAFAVDAGIYLYFTALGADSDLQTTLQTIGLTIFNGTSWSTPAQVLKPDQSVYPRSQYYGYSTPQPCIYNGQALLMFDIVADPWQQVAIANAISADGQTNWALNTLPTIVRDAPWRSSEVLAPSALQDADGLHVWFAGNNGVNLSIGYTKLPTSPVPPLGEVSTSETASAAETQSASRTTPTAIQESAPASELQNGAIVSAKVLVEAATATDTQNRALSSARAVAEAATAADTQTAAQAAARIVAEAGTATDSTTATTGIPTLGQSEAAAASDSTSVTIAIPTISIAEPAAASDSTSVALAPVVKTQAEAATASETTGASLSSAKQQQEAGNATESASSVLTRAASQAESTAATDIQSSAATFSRTVAEAAVATDTSFTGTGPKQVEEVAAAADSQDGTVSASRGVAEVAAATDATSVVLTGNAAQQETVVAIDETNATSGTLRLQVEAAEATDQASPTLAAVRSVVEAAPAVDSQNATASSSAAQSEAGAAVDVQAGATVRQAAQEEAAVADDAQVLTIDLNSLVAEAATATEEAIASAEYAAATNEQADATDSVQSGGASIYGSVVESGNAEDDTSASVGSERSVTEVAVATDHTDAEQPPSPGMGKRSAHKPVTPHKFERPVEDRVFYAPVEHRTAYKPVTDHTFYAPVDRDNVLVADASSNVLEAT